MTLASPLLSPEAVYLCLFLLGVSVASGCVLVALFGGGRG